MVNYDKIWSKQSNETTNQMDTFMKIIMKAKDIEDFHFTDGLPWLLTSSPRNIDMARHNNFEYYSYENDKTVYFII